MIRVPLATYYSHRTGVVVEMDDESRYVRLILEAEGESEQDRDRMMTTEEARAVAAMLLHYANEAERPR